MTDDTKEFIENWENQIADIDTDNLDGLFNKFRSLYTIYNRLYNESYTEMENLGTLVKPRYSDFETATTLVVDFLNSTNLIDSLSDQQSQTDINDLQMLIRNQVFNINLAKGQPQPQKDAELLANLGSVKNDIKAQAILSLIYNVRNNVVHGHKDFVEHQRLLLEPLINILQKIITLQKNKLI